MRRRQSRCCEEKTLDERESRNIELSKVVVLAWSGFKDDGSPSYVFPFEPTGDVWRTFFLLYAYFPVENKHGHGMDQVFVGSESRGAETGSRDCTYCKVGAAADALTRVRDSTEELLRF